MISLDKYKEAFAQLPAHIKEAEVNAETHDVIVVAVNDGKVIDYQVKNFTDLYIRIAAEKNGYVYTQALNEDVYELLDKAYQNSLVSEKISLENMNRENKKVVYSNKKANGDIKELTEKTLQIEKYIKEHLELTNVEVELHAETYGQNTVNSYGFEAVNYVPLYILTVSANNGVGYALLDQTKNSLDGFDLDYFVDNLKGRLENQKNPLPTFKSGLYSVIFSQEAAYNMLATAWQQLAANKYLENGSIYSGKLNEKVMADCLNFTDYYCKDNSGFDFRCDCEGSKGVDMPLVRNGVIVGLLSNTTTAAAMNIPNSANAGRRPLLFGNIATDILVTPKNFCVEPSETTLEEMIEHMQNGILITEYFDIFHSLNIASGEFNVPCYGVLIENGKKVGNLKALTMSGNLKDLLLNAKEVGNDFIVRPMNYLRNYGIGACSIRFDKVMISGE